MPMVIPPARQENPFSLRAILIGTLLIPLNIYWITVMEVRWYTLDSSCLPLFITPVFFLFILVLLNLLVYRRGRVHLALIFFLFSFFDLLLFITLSYQTSLRLFPILFILLGLDYILYLLPRNLSLKPLSSGELLVIYMMLVMSTAMGGTDSLQYLFGLLGYPFQFATPENKWAETILTYLPKWLFVSQKDALEAFYGGGAREYLLSHLHIWAKPLFYWGIYVMVLVFTMLCLNVMVRKQWTEAEKLSFPIIQLPVEMTRGGGEVPLFKNRLLWIGFALAFLIGSLNGIASLLPYIPRIPVSAWDPANDLGQYVVTHPWNAIGWTPLSKYPFAIGLAFFIPADLSFSCWFFYVFRKLLQVLGRATGWEGTMQGFPFFNEQASGAWLALAFVALWGSKNFLWGVIKKAFGKGEMEDSDEPLSYRSAVSGFLLGWAVLLFFAYKAGMAVWASFVFFSIYFLLALAMTRVRAELGTPHEIYFVNPENIMGTLLGSKTIGKQNAIPLWFFYWLNRCYRTHPMPNQLEAFKIGDVAKIPQRGIMWVILFSTFISLLAAYFFNLFICYSEGAGAKCMGFKDQAAVEGFNHLNNWLNYGKNVEKDSIVAFLVGFILVILLRIARWNLWWWPFHPAGYALAVSYAMDYFWFSFFLSWLLKVILLRVGGMKLHRKAIPFFLGLILGDYVIGSIWGILAPFVFQERITFKTFI